MTQRGLSVRILALTAFCAHTFLTTPVSADEEKAAAPTPAATVENSPGVNPEVLMHPNHRRFNVRLVGGANIALGDDLEKKGFGNIGGIGAIGIDWVLFEPLAFSILAGYSAFTEGDESALQDLFVTVGFRLRLFTDRSGSIMEEGGNIAGHLFLDAHFGYHSYERQEHAGYNVGLGYEFSISRDFNLGPFVRFTHSPIGDGFEYKSISFGLQFSIGGKFHPDDADEDGIEDPQDACPLSPEDKDGFEDKDGCEEPDNDKDGVPDVDDDCPETVGVASNRGCEENDNDHDGIPNDDDNCPDEAEDKDEFSDEDGCPDPDNDGDKIDDTSDKCINDAEDKDGFEDEDGCPDKDNDEDKIPDEADKCPYIPETINEVSDKDGCPDFITLTGKRILLNDSVQFAPNKAEIKAQSLPMLDEIASLLKLKHELIIRIEGHTDNRGGKKRNQALSLTRAESIKKYLVDKGVASNRLEAVGIGQASPIAENTTKAGRAKNNRIELHIVASAEKEKTSQAPTPVDSDKSTESDSSGEHAEKQQTKDAKEKSAATPAKKNEPPKDKGNE